MAVAVVVVVVVVHSRKVRKMLMKRKFEDLYFQRYLEFILATDTSYIRVQNNISIVMCTTICIENIFYKNWFSKI